VWVKTSHIPTIEGARRDHYQSAISAMGFKLYYQMLQDNSQHGPPKKLILLGSLGYHGGYICTVKQAFIFVW